MNAAGMHFIYINSKNFYFEFDSIYDSYVDQLLNMYSNDLSFLDRYIKAQEDSSIFSFFQVVLKALKYYKGLFTGTSLDSYKFYYNK